MRARTIAVVVVVLCALVGASFYSITNKPSGSLSVNWISNTGRPNQLNHHPVVAERIDGEPYIFAPVSQVAGKNARCAATRLDTNGSVRWQYEINSSACAIHGIGDSLVADATGDHQPDILAPTTENRLYVFNAGNGSVEWKQNLTSFGYAGPTILTKPRRLIVQPAFYGVVFADSPNGTLQWKYDVNEHSDLNETVSADAQVIHVPGSPHQAVAIGSDQHVTVLHPNGTVAWRRPALATWLAKGHLGQQDILVASGGDGEVTAFTANGTKLWQRNGWYRPELDQVTDGNGDGVPDVYVGGKDTITALNARTGKAEWKTKLSTDSKWIGAPVAGDVNGDGSLEVVAVTNHGTVEVLNANTGEVLASYERKVRVWVHPTVCDIDGDGKDEIFVMYGDGRVVELSYHK